MQLDMIQAVFWDFDGVIADSVNVKVQAFEEMFAPYGDEVLKKTMDHHRENGGISRVEKIENSFRHYIGQPLTPQELEKQCEIYSGMVKEKVVKAPLIAGAESTLAELYPKVPMFVISGTPEDELLEIVEKRNLGRYFKRVLGSPVKKPEHVNNLLREFDFDPAGCVFIGDALTDFNAAEVTGTHFIGIHGFNTFPEGTVVLPDCTGIVPALEAI